MQKTEYLKLNKPDSTDFFSVDHQNQNMELIDAEFAKKADKKEIENIKAEFDNVNSDLSRKLDNSAVGADSLLSKITTLWVDTPTDDTYFIRQNTGGKSNFGRVKFSTLWSYIKGKADKVYAALTHTHTKSQITDFPTSMPANGGNSTTVNSHTVNSNVPANAKFTDTVYTHPTNSGYKHIPSGGSDGQILKWSSDGTAKWSDNILVDSEINNTSTNPVQNKVITAALDGKMPVYSYNGGTFDANDLTSPAIHLINSGGTNLPASCSGGVLLVDGSSQTTQYFFPLYNGDNRIHTRYKYHGTKWTDWEILGLSTSQSTAITTAGKYALDAVQNNASVSGTLANKISNATVISKGTLALASFFGSVYEKVLKKCWKTVYISICAVRTDGSYITSTDTIATIPSGYRPSNTIFGYPVLVTNTAGLSATAFVNINKDGTIKSLLNPSNVANITWLYLNVTYIID